MINKPTKTGRAGIRRNALAVALAIGLGLTGGAAIAQSTQGQIFGNAPAAAGESVTVTSDTGLTRTVQVNADGSYTTANLPAGKYTVTLMKDGSAADKHTVSVQPGAGTQVNFASEQSVQELGTISVSASALPSIDVSQPAASYTVTAEQLAQLPLGRDVNAISILSPGVVASSGYFGNALTFAGAGATENAYYINGFNTTSLYNYTGPSVQLPYGAIGSQETKVGGYGAKYGRADGGVISQTGKRGTNEWHFGAQMTWKPRSLMADPDSINYPNPELDPGEKISGSNNPGDLYQDRTKNKYWSTSQAAYVGGPLVEDKLFIFLAAQQDKNSRTNVGSVAGQVVDYYKSHSTDWYGKIDWNISDNNILEYTRLQSNEKNGYGETWRYDNATGAAQYKLNDDPYGKYSLDTDILHYTGYLTDKATLSILYGRTDVSNPDEVPGLSDLPALRGVTSQDPSITGGNSIVNDQSELYIGSPDSGTNSRGLRIDLDYQLGDHLLQAGIDNLDYTAQGQGQAMSGPGYAWIYNVGDPDEAINPSLGVGAPGGDGYFVREYIYETVTSMSATQDAWYIQDQWQATDNLLLKIGLRNDEFTNSNADGDAFVVQENQWEPRIGVSWDVFGDSSFKVYGNLGRYYLAIPQATGERAAGGSVYKYRYFTYTGIDSNGVPTGLTPVPAVGGGDSDYVSANNEFGQSKDPDTVTSKNLKPQYQDELIVGFDKTLGDNWVYGAKGTYRTVGTVIDDMCDKRVTAAAIDNAGYDHNNYAYNACFIMNPNQTNMYKFTGLNGYDDIVVPASQELHHNPDVQRDYYALDFYLTHPFDGTWYGKVSYTFARSWGNAEGQVRSDIGQTDVSVTEDWDYWELMDHARGYLANHRRHQLKAYGAYQITPEWLVSGNALAQSGMPRNCLGYFGPDKTNPGGGYGPDYHWCRGEPSPPGSDFNPWTYRIDLGVQYTPSFAQGLKVGLDIFNVLDGQQTTQTLANRMSGPNVVSNQYNRTRFMQTPRTVRLSLSYDY